MATNYLFSEHLDDSVAFDPSADTITFDATILPTDVAPGDQKINSIFTAFIQAVSGPYEGHAIELTGDVAARNLATSNWIFESGGLWLFGDNTAGRANDNGPNTLVGTDEADAFAGVGGNDSMVGNGGDDFFYQSNNGALGKDTLQGGAGADWAIYDDAGTQLTANLGAGTVSGGMALTDRAQLASIENFVGGELGDSIVGSSGANKLIGYLGDDTILGGDGADQLYGFSGHDRLTGGSGADKFGFDAAPKAGNSDVIADFAPGIDKIWLDNGNTLFLKAGPNGPLAQGAFYAADGATAAHDASDRLIYDSSTGKLYYDADGTNGAKLPVLVATLAGAPDLDYTDFRVV